MTTVRCYVPLTPSQLTSLHQERRLEGQLPAHAVTAQLRAAHPSGDLDEWEHVALQDAAAGLIDRECPVIIAAVDASSERVELQPASGSRVTITDLDLPRVAALHLGDDVVTGDRSTRPGMGGEIELSWYDTTELAHVVDLARKLVPADPA